MESSSDRASRGPAVSPAQLQVVAFETAGDRLLTGRAGLNFQDPAESGPTARLMDWPLWVQDPCAGGHPACCSHVTAGSGAGLAHTCPPGTHLHAVGVQPSAGWRPRGCPVAPRRQHLERPGRAEAPWLPRATWSRAAWGLALSPSRLLTEPGASSETRKRGKLVWGQQARGSHDFGVGR